MLLSRSTAHVLLVGAVFIASSCEAGRCKKMEIDLRAGEPWEATEVDQVALPAIVPS